MDERDREVVEAVVGRPILAIEPLGGLTNRNYRVETAQEVLAVRLPGSGSEAYIDRAAERHNAERAAAMGANCPISSVADDGTMVCHFLHGAALTPERVRGEPATRAGVAQLLRRVHEEAGPFEGRFDPAAEVARHRSALARVPEGVDDLIDQLVGAIEPDPPLRPCHNDTWPPNFIDTSHRLYLVDWEYSGMNDPAWDLADLAVEAGLDPAAEADLLRAYGGPDPDLAERVRVLKPVTDLLWGLWALVQHADGNPADDFETYAHQRLARAAAGYGPPI